MVALIFTVKSKKTRLVHLHKIFRFFQIWVLQKFFQIFIICNFGGIIEICSGAIFIRSILSMMMMVGQIVYPLDNEDMLEI